LIACSNGSKEGTMRNRWLFGAALLVPLALVGVACGTGQPATTGEGPVRVGAIAPGFTLASAQGGTVSLTDYRGHKAVLLYFSMGPG
jgi:cytochrome oxidase Cu insertion factor (SCO1/SenC/PrrC family)